MSGGIRVWSAEVHSQMGLVACTGDDIGGGEIGSGEEGEHWGFSVFSLASRGRKSAGVSAAGLLRGCRLLRLR